MLYLNATDWQAFSPATGTAYADLATVAGLPAAAEKYYNWTDAQTEAPDDGGALFGRDAMANYLLIGAKELGCTIFDVQTGKMPLDFDKNVMAVAHGDKTENYHMVSNSIFNLYNQLTAITTLREAGLTEEQVQKSFDKLNIVESRYSKESVKDNN